MGDTTNERVSQLLKTLKIDEVEASQRIGKNSSTLYRITSKSNAPTKTTLKLIADSLGANYNWLLTGSGDMFKADTENPWRDALVSQIKDENNRLQKELERVWQMVQHLSGGAKPNFLKASENAYTFKLFPGMEQVKSVSGAMAS